MCSRRCPRQRTVSPGRRYRTSGARRSIRPGGRDLEARDRQRRGGRHAHVGPGYAGGAGGEAPADISVKAAFIYNFAKFVEWPALPSGSPIVVCISGDDAIAAVLVETVRGQNISGHTLEVRRSQGSATWPVCHLLFIADAEVRRSAGGLSGIRALPVLTVSDGKGFSHSGGIIELFVEDGKMRFAVNMDAVQRSGLHLSSRLLGLAKVVRDGQ